MANVPETLRLIIDHRVKPLKKPYTVVNDVQNSIARLTHELKDCNIETDPAKTYGLILSCQSTLKKPSSLF